FDPSFYDDGEHLRLYLAHYFPANVGKLQLVLLELLRAGHLPSRLRILDVGVGTGTTVAAVVDFVLGLAAVCDLLGMSLPVRELSYVGLDRSPGCLRFARRVTESLRSIVDDHVPDCSPANETESADPAGGGPELSRALRLVRAALASPTFLQGDLLVHPDVPGATVHVLS